MFFFNFFRSASKSVKTPVAVVSHPVKVVEYKTIEAEVEVEVQEPETPKPLTFEELVKKTEEKIAAKQQLILQVAADTQHVTDFVTKVESEAKEAKAQREQETQVLKSLGTTLHKMQKEVSQRSAEYNKFSQEQAEVVAELNAAESEANNKHETFFNEFEGWLNNI